MLFVFLNHLVYLISSSLFLEGDLFLTSHVGELFFFSNLGQFCDDWNIIDSWDIKATWSLELIVARLRQLLLFALRIFRLFSLKGCSLLIITAV